MNPIFTRTVIFSRAFYPTAPALNKTASRLCLALLTTLFLFAGTAAHAQDVTYAIEPNDESSLEFVGYKILGSKQGGFADYHGLVEVPAGDITKAKVTLTVNINSMYTEHRELSDVLKGDDFFQAAKFPKAEFVSTQIKKVDNGYEVTGDFTMHGATKKITFPAQIELTPEKLHAVSEFQINRQDWGLVWNGFGENIMKNEVTIRFDITAYARKK